MELPDRVVDVDGGPVHVLEPGAVETLAADASPFAPYDRWLQWLARFVASHHKDFELGWFIVGPSQWRQWIALYSLAGQRVRTHIEELLCERHGGKVLAANATITDLYAGLPDYMSKVVATKSLTEVPCPKCGAKLPRLAVWAEAEA